MWLLKRTVVTQRDMIVKEWKERSLIQNRPDIIQILPHQWPFPHLCECEKYQAPTMVQSECYGAVTSYPLPAIILSSGWWNPLQWCLYLQNALITADVGRGRRVEQITTGGIRYTPVFMVIPSPIAKVQATQKCICLVDHHNLFVVCPQEDAHLGVVRVSQHLHISSITYRKHTNSLWRKQKENVSDAFSIWTELQTLKLIQPYHSHNINLSLPLSHHDADGCLSD
jgi:hypothetical protein